ncbi:TolC family protein [uncultured Tateyamaria sp.]|uniref:TolC family protein n=2 Tax=uncultured Tateyamaria sp. TaxID=455651 RepID=UPI00261E3D63|nr:TolC family protein [uncultured Tateyamaria sp.]
MGQGGIKVAAMFAAVSLTAGCLGETGGVPFVSKLSGGADAQVQPAGANGTKVAALAQTPTANDETLNAESVVITGLLARRSVLPAGSAYDRVSTAVLAANARAAETELRAARLRAQAASKNWLPTIGPRISLNSLGDIITQIVVDQVIFDNGRKKGERAFAKADVEVAAVTLAEDTNDRVATGLGLYLSAAEAREVGALHRTTLREMEHFEYIMSERVRGGVSDMSDLHVIRQKLSEIRASIAASEETSATAIAELNAMAAQPLDDVRGLETLAISAQAAQPLTVTRADAEKERSIAQAQIDRASQLPGINAQATVGENSGAGLTVGGANFGLGTAARLKSIEAAKEAAGRQVAQANEDANRTLRRLEGDVTATGRQAGEARGLTAQAKANLDLFQEQYEAGRRQVMDVVGVYETFAQRQNAEVALKYEALRLQVELARVQGVLADGDQI